MNTCRPMLTPRQRCSLTRKPSLPGHRRAVRWRVRLSTRLIKLLRLYVCATIEAASVLDTAFRYSIFLRSLAQLSHRKYGRETEAALSTRVAHSSVRVGDGRARIQK